MYALKRQASCKSSYVYSLTVGPANTEASLSILQLFVNLCKILYNYKAFCHPTSKHLKCFTHTLRGRFRAANASRLYDSPVPHVCTPHTERRLVYPRVHLLAAQAQRFLPNSTTRACDLHLHHSHVCDHPGRRRRQSPGKWQCVRLVVPGDAPGHTDGVLCRTDHYGRTVHRASSASFMRSAQHSRPAVGLVHSSTPLPSPSVRRL
jgi:hypothetical protein